MSDQPTIQRPNGKLYRPRKAPSVETYADPSDNTGVVILRTHNVEQAVELAAGTIREYDLDPSKAYTTWWRLVPYDPDGWFDTTWQNDPVRGMPCVVIPTWESR